MRKCEVDLFSEAEYIKAFELVTDRKQARKLAKNLSSDHSTGDEAWQLSPDVLDLLSLVSEDCAKRAAAILKLSPEEAGARRKLFQERLRRE